VRIMLHGMMSCSVHNLQGQAVVGGGAATLGDHMPSKLLTCLCSTCSTSCCFFDQHILPCCCLPPPVGHPAPSLSQVLSCLLTPPPAEAVAEAVGQLVALGALQQPQPGQDGECLTPLGSHLCAMPMDAALGKALLYGCMLRWGAAGNCLALSALAHQVEWQSCL
jgi:hypothetical protein